MSLFDRAMSFNYGDDERAELMRKVWTATPYMTNCNTGSDPYEKDREILLWCYDRWGDQASPIHGRAGRWQRGHATVFGWTWFGFETAEMLAEFEATWECRDDI